ncbi:ABC transporter ATP-binding protein [Salipiger abyssi]|uniref:ABC transporter ATP-binding protein n=1 Tax=Salipiger abyssi TaxID=1250539 RepID=UPI0040582CFE
MTDLIDIAGVVKRFANEPDFAERLAGMLGARIDTRAVHAVDGVSLRIGEGEVVGLVGESGCGKSTLGRMVAGLIAPTEGQIAFRGRDVTGGSQRRKQDALAIQMIFQDPMASLNPRMRVRDLIGEAPQMHGLVSRGELSGYVSDLLDRVGLSPDVAQRYPHQFSGGQRARVGIARALALNPELVVCDESVAALDVSIQAQVLNLFMDLREKLGLAYLFISHDLGVVEHISDRIAVMYLGRIVEQGAATDLIARPNHPYTQAMVSEIPRIGTQKRRFSAIKGEIPSPLSPPPGCHFHPRCPFATERCRSERPALREVAPGRLSACHLNDSTG